MFTNPMMRAPGLMAAGMGRPGLGARPGMGIGRGLGGMGHAPMTMAGRRPFAEGGAADTSAPDYRDQERRRQLAIMQYLSKGDLTPSGAELAAHAYGVSTPVMAPTAPPATVAPLAVPGMPRGALQATQAAPVSSQGQLAGQATLARAQAGQPIVPYDQPPGYAHGGALNNMRHFQGPGGGQDDKIDAKLSDGEVVWPADVVSHVGDGSNNEGARRLMAASDAIRAEKAKASSGGKYPKAAKPPLAYIKKAAGGLAGIKSDRLPPETHGTSPSVNSAVTGVRG